MRYGADEQANQFDRGGGESAGTARCNGFAVHAVARAAA
jgi:hypothetical protein